MALVIEDGTIVAGANSYITLGDYQAHATERGLTIPADAILEQKIFMAMDWFEGNCFKSDRVDVLTPQDLSFPRKGLIIDGVTIPNDEIAPLVKSVIIQATADAITIDLEPSIAGTDKGSLKLNKIDELEKEYYAVQFSDKMPYLTRLLKLVEPLLGGASGRLQVVRV